MENKQFPQEEPLDEVTLIPDTEEIPEVAAAEILEEVLNEVAPEEIIAEIWEDVSPSGLMDEILEDVSPNALMEEILEDTAPEDITNIILEEVLEEVVPEDFTDEILEEVLNEVTPEEISDEILVNVSDEIPLVSEPSPSGIEELMDFDLEEPDYDEGFRDIAEDSGFDELFQTPEELPPEEPKNRPPRKGRPKRKKGYGLFGIPHLIATAVWLAIIVSVGVSLGRMLWLCAADVLAFGREDKQVTITIAAEDDITDIAGKLHSAGLIRYPGLFKLYASIAVDDGEIATGTFTLNTIYDYHAIVNGMSAYSSFRNVIEDVLIPEGYNCRQIFELLEQKGICTVAELEEYAANGEFSNYWFLEGVPRGDKYCLEGFLFPDTYDFYEGSTPREALGKMLTGFNSRFTEEMRAKITTLNATLSAMMRARGCSDSYIAENQFSVYEVMIVASLIEEETSSAAESPKIASVIYNRLTEDQAFERLLGIDAALLYGLGEHKEELTAADLALDTPYNTRIHSGLVPTPITNPGLDSISAALNPAETDYYYYLLNPSTGVHTFSKTAAEHDALKEKYGY